MPIYPYKCPCGEQFEVIKKIVAYNTPEPCPKCGTLLAEKDWETICKKSSIHVFEPDWYEHLDDKPIFIESRRHLKRECDKRGLTSVYLANLGIPL